MGQKDTVYTAEEVAKHNTEVGLFKSALTVLVAKMRSSYVRVV